MYELVRVTENDYYIECPSKIGIVRLDAREAILIDSGNDKDAGKKALRYIEEMGLTLRAIYNTHAHADHIGGNALVQKRTGCKIYAYQSECAMTNFSAMEPEFLYGAEPVKDLCVKFYMAEESVCLPLTEKELPEGFRMIPLPGHTSDMVGFLTPDGTFYLGDALIAPRTFEKHGMGYNFSIGGTLESIETLRTVPAKIFVPAHAEVCTDINPLADYNRDAILRIGQDILHILETPAEWQTVLAELFTLYGLTMDIGRYALLGDITKSYLTWLMNRGDAEYYFENNRMMWRKTA